MIQPHNRVVQVRRFGSPDGLEVVDAPLPTAGRGEVRVRVLASSVQYTDVLIRRHLYPQTAARRPPFVLGYDVVGEIDPYRTVTGYVVTPVLAVVEPDQPLSPHEHEVADWFEAPLAFILDARNQHLKSALFRGRERHYYEIVWNDRRIWGATAAMLVNLSRRLRWS